MSVKKEIIIDLSQTDNDLVELESIIQVGAMIKVDDLIREFVENSKAELGQSDSTDDFFRRRYNNSILINGQRGYGKTTLSKGILKKYMESKDVCPLIFIDPTLLNTNENIIIHIMDSLFRKVQKKIGSCCDNQKDHADFKAILTAISAGLKSISSPIHDQSWIFNEALIQSRNDRNLENSIAEFFKFAAKILDYKLFLIVLDDVDTKTSKAYDILEIVRCYMTSPYVCTIVTGDKDLYRYIILKNKSEELHFNWIESFSGAKDRFEKLSSNLEEQYLLKLFENRKQVDVINLYDAVSKSKIPFKLKENSNKEEVNHYLLDLIGESLKIPLEYREPYVTLILKLPIRKLIFLLNTTSKDNKKNPLAFIRNIENLFIKTISNERDNTQESYFDLVKKYLIQQKNNEQEDNGIFGTLAIGETEFNIKQLYIASKTPVLFSKGNSLENLSLYMIYCYINNVMLNEKFSMFFKKEKKTIFEDQDILKIKDAEELSEVISKNLLLAEPVTFQTFATFQIKNLAATDPNWADLFSRHFKKNAPTEKSRPISDLGSKYFDYHKDYLNPSLDNLSYIIVFFLKNSLLKNEEHHNFSFLKFMTLISSITEHTLKKYENVDLNDASEGIFSENWFFIKEKLNITKHKEDESKNPPDVSQFLLGKIWTRFMVGCFRMQREELECAGITINKIFIILIYSLLVEEFNHGYMICKNRSELKITNNISHKNPKNPIKELKENLAKITENKKINYEELLPLTTSILKSTAVSRLIAYCGIDSNGNNIGIMEELKPFFQKDNTLLEKLYGKEAQEKSKTILMYLSLLMVQK